MTLTNSRSHDIPGEKRDIPPAGRKEKKPISWSTGHHMDYFTEKGIELRTGYQNKRDWYLLTIKELFDNAIDFFWEQYPGVPKGAAVITTNIEIDDSYFRLTVRNSNPDNKSVPFTVEDLANILDFTMRYGSKQNKHIISRGTLGDALKQTVAFPHVLQDIKNRTSRPQQSLQRWTIPTYFRANGIERYVTVYLDFATEEAKPIIIENSTKKVSHTETEIEVTFPMIPEVLWESNRSKCLTSLDVLHFCKQYLIFTTDVSFKVKIFDKSNRVEAGLLPRTTIDAPALHGISPKWFNKSSIHSYELDEFRKTLLRVNEPEDTKIFDILEEVLPREASQLSQKRPDLSMTIADLISDSQRENKIEKLYDELREKSNPLEKLSLPYSHIRPKERKEHLINRIVQIYGLSHIHYGKFDISRAIYKILDSEKVRTPTTNGVQYPFAFEIIAIPIDRDYLIDQGSKGGEESKIFPTRFIAGAVNYTVSPKANTFQGDYGKFAIFVKGGKKTEDNPRGRMIHHVVESKSGGVTVSIKDILTEYGYSFSEDGYSLHQKMPCIIAANLITPKVSYQSHDKSAINATPFTHAIIRAVEELANDDNTRTITGAGITLLNKKTGREVKATSKGSDTKAPEIKHVINEVIGEDCATVKQAKAEGKITNEEEMKKLIPRQRTQMSIWYNSLPIWTAAKVEKESMPLRRSFLPEIPNVTAHYGLKREEVGIVAAPWATLYYQGRWYGISFKDIEDLSKKGTDIVFIEKQDIVAALGPHADIYGVGLVNTRGQLVDYAKDLARLAMRKEGELGGQLGWRNIPAATKETAGGNIAIFTDYDIPGIHIASKLPGVLWLGVDERMLRHFKISQKTEGVVDYQPKKRLKEDTVYEILQDPRFSSKKIVDIDFLDKHKVEIDAVLAHVNNNPKRIWDYLQTQLEQAYPTRNYLRVLTKRPDSLQHHYPPGVRKLLAYIDKITNDATEEEATKIEKELQQVKGFLKVEDTRQEIDKRHGDRIKAFDAFNNLAAAISEMDRKHGFGIADIEIEEDEEEGGYLI